MRCADRPDEQGTRILRLADRRSRTNGERESGARTGNGVSWRVILYIMNSGTARRYGDDIA
jgi:hypothetical protein